jgi:tetratricopeptide (TPR) repeat protein
MSRWKSLLAPLVVGALSLGSVTAWASSEDRPAAEARFKDGIRAYKAGRYPEALGSYQEALSLAPSAAGPYRELGKALEALGKTDAACGAYAEYLRRRPGADDAAEIKARLQALEPGEGARGYLFLAPGAKGELWLSGSPVGSAEIPVVLPTGNHVIELRYAGKATFAQVQIKASESSYLEMSAFQTAAPAAALAVAPAGSAAAPEAGVHKKRRRFWVILGSSLAVGAAASVTAIVASNADNDGSGRGRGRGGDDND